jgi:hypothetical protein
MFGKNNGPSGDAIKHSKPSKTKQGRLSPDNLRMVSSLSQ